MALSKPCVLLVLVLMFLAQAHRLPGADSRPHPILEQTRYSKVFKTLGIGCKCCDGKEGVCRSTWDGSCTRLQCLPWKFS
ncbi:hypothetical protein IFM89_018914 [Coptis chinensis]|uniref:Uncharacterized protein n=1 Tax=Coptis chinensis TaxID=261450 RepID=A0A835HG24_9MAGN|nr:hypothetical protein IFM89_018914 [Coptis chinensis]